MSRLTQILRGKKLTPLTDLESAVATALETTGSELPAVSGTDNGKLLKVVSGKWSKADAPAALPTVTTDDNGNILKVSDGAWAKAAAELPAVTAVDNGSILKVADGAWAKAAPADKSPLIVDGTAGENNSVTITETLATIKAAWDAGRVIVLELSGARLPAIWANEVDSAVALQFSGTTYSETDSAVINQTVTFSDSQTGTLVATKLATAQA